VSTRNRQAIGCVGERPDPISTELDTAHRECETHAVDDAALVFRKLMSSFDLTLGAHFVGKITTEIEPVLHELIRSMSETSTYDGTARRKVLT
jgi:hypothetical protein